MMKCLVEQEGWQNLHVPCSFCMNTQQIWQISSRNHSPNLTMGLEMCDNHWDSRKRKMVDLAFLGTFCNCLHIVPTICHILEACLAL